jgi:hypothetical protein
MEVEYFLTTNRPSIPLFNDVVKKYVIILSQPQSVGTSKALVFKKIKERNGPALEGGQGGGNSVRNIPLTPPYPPQRGSLSYITMRYFSGTEVDPCGYEYECQTP